LIKGGAGEGSRRRLVRKMVLPVSPWSACFLMWYAQRIFGDIFGDLKNSKKVGRKIICWTPYWRLDQTGNGGANANNNKSWPKSLIISDYGRIRYYKQILLKFGRAPITNVISNTYRTVSIIPYWELTHQANPNIHHTPW
jgi:hypothetical protein